MEDQEESIELKESTPITLDDIRPSSGKEKPQLKDESSENSSFSRHNINTIEEHPLEGQIEKSSIIRTPVESLSNLILDSKKDPPAEQHLPTSSSLKKSNSFVGSHKSTNSGGRFNAKYESMNDNRRLESTPLAEKGSLYSLRDSVNDEDIIGFRRKRHDNPKGTWKKLFSFGKN